MKENKLSKKQETQKRIFDIVISIAILIIVFPLMLIIAILIKITSKGEIIYKQKRITKNGKEFIMYKFRTMIKDAEKETGPILAKVNDSRITKIGKILRKTRMDELPQFLNVIKGDMSIVGPRPERKEILQNIEKDFPEYKERQNVKAGITCIAHIKGDYYTKPKERLKYDKIYMEDWSLKKDVKIIFATIKKIVRQNIRKVENKES